MNSFPEIEKLNLIGELILKKDAPLRNLTHELKLVLSSIIDILDRIDLDTKGLEYYQNKKLGYEWSLEAKQMAILIRDIILRKYKDHQKLQDLLIDKEAFQDRRKEEVYLLTEAWNYVSEFLSKIRNSQDIDEAFLEKWKHQYAPYLVVNDQLVDLQEQIDVITIANETLIQLRNDIRVNQSRIKDNFIWINSACSNLKDYLQEAKILVESLDSEDAVKKMGITRVELDKIYKKIEKYRPQPPIFNFDSSEDGRSIIPTGVAKGQLVVKEIDFGEHINSWIESELYTSYLDEKSIIDRQYDNVLITIFNIRNRIAVLETDDVEDFSKEINSLLIRFNNLDETLTETDNNVEEYSEKILTQLDQAMVVSKVFDQDKIFFPVIGQAAYLDIKKGARWLGTIPFEKLFLKTRQFVKSLLTNKVDSANALLNTISYTDAKKLSDDTLMSKSLFFNKGYLGKSFYIHRDQIETKILETYQYWKKGFGGSVLLHGRRLSGKSSVLDAIHDTISDEEIVKLKPGLSINYIGRKYETGKDLKSALEFLIKHSISRRVIVLIDDLELWRGDTTNFYENMIALQEAVTKFGRRIFFVVATNNWMKAHLDNHMGMSRLFVVRVSTNQMKINDIIAAIKIRHAATFHGSLIDSKNGNKEQIIYNKARKVSLASKGNIGASLKEWGRLTALYKEDFDAFQLIPMPIDVREHLLEYRLILTHLFRFKQTSELELRDMIGDSFVREVNQDIQSLIGLGILMRSINGTFTINEMVIHKVEEVIFQQKGKLSYKDE